MKATELAELVRRYHAALADERYLEGAIDELADRAAEIAKESRKLKAQLKALRAERPLDPSTLLEVLEAEGR